ncbi:MAG: PAS domain S-box protein [Candidatus Lokiarchaeota archaeon]|nr:PAS domain S-box protein [Candidatus Lokiarchaeota archaeon]
MKGKRMSELKNELYNSLFECFPDLIFLIDSKGRILDVSKSVLEHGVLRKNKIIDQLIFNFIHPSQIDSVKQNFSALLNNGKLDKKEYKLKRLDGSYYSAEISAISIEKDNSKYILAIIRDISDKKKARNQLENKKEMFQLVIDNIPQHIYWKDRDSVYKGCNENFARVAGIQDPEHIIGKTDYDLAWKRSEADSFYEIDHLVMELDKPEYHVIEPQMQANGKQAWRDTNRIPLHDGNGKVIGVLGTYEDITERIRAEMALSDSKKKYEKAFNRAEFYKDIFAHDISNILQSILSSIELCHVYLNKQEDENKDDNELKMLLKIVNEQIDRGNLLISNIKKLSLLEKSSNINTTENIHLLLKNTVQRILEENSDKKIELDVNRAENNQLFVRGNEYLDDALYNILNNSIEHNDNEKIQIIINISEVMRAHQDWIKIEIIDNGKGIPNKQKDAILGNLREKSQVSNRIGLGLLFVEKIIALCGGEISIKDRIEGTSSKGTNFTVYLPKE